MESLDKILQDNSVEIDMSFTVQHLEVKIMKVFSNDIQLFTIRKKKILAPKYLEAIGDTVLENLQSENILQKSALILRKLVLQIEKRKLPSNNITAQHLMSGEVSIPQPLLDFYFTLLGGCSPNRKNRNVLIERKYVISTLVAYHLARASYYSISYEQITYVQFGKMLTNKFQQHFNQRIMVGN